MKTIEVRSAGITDTGKLRTDNQDSFLVSELTRGMKVLSGASQFQPNARLTGSSFADLFIVADGMGGHRGGSEASTFAVQFCANTILNNLCLMDTTDASNDEAFVADLRLMFENAHRAIEAQSKTNHDWAGMGTTLTLAYVVWPRMFIVHAGDTRCYLIRNGELRLLTRDHTVANEMIAKGQLAAEELERSHWSNVLVNALGAGASGVKPDIYQIDLKMNDSILLCSDGLNKHVADFQILKTLKQLDAPEQVCEELVSMAKAGGGSDNITVVVANFRSKETREVSMPLTMLSPTQETLLQELMLPASELDTNDDEQESQQSTKDFGSQSGFRDTCDFTEK